MERIATALGAVACACLVFLMVLTFGDVIGRYFFSAPITFTVEITELLMGLVILLGVGLTTLKQGHITVDVVTRMLPPPLRRYQEMLAGICVVIGFGVITWQLFEQTVMVYGDGLFTQIMGVPVYPFAAVMTLSAAFSCLIALWVLRKNTQGTNDGSS